MLKNNFQIAIHKGWRFFYHSFLKIYLCSLNNKNEVLEKAES